MTSDAAKLSQDRDVVFNRVNLALARRQGLVASLMGLGSAEKIGDRSTSEITSDEQESFTADPELCVCRHITNAGLTD